MSKKGVIQQRTVATGKAYVVNEEEIELPGGQRVCRTVVRHTGSVVIVPVLPDGRLVVIRQYRHALADHILEFPAGTIDAGETPLTCAKRELIEETHHRGTDWIDLGMQYPAPGFCDEAQYCYLAKGLVPEQGVPDEDEIIDVQILSVSQVEELIRSHAMPDAKSLACFLKARLQGFI